jgi:hypothetical protein
MDETSEGLRSEIAHLRRLAAGVTDQQVRDAIAKMIEELEQRRLHSVSAAGSAILAA